MQDDDNDLEYFFDNLKKLESALKQNLTGATVRLLSLREIGRRY